MKPLFVLLAGIVAVGLAYIVYTQMKSVEEAPAQDIQQEAGQPDLLPRESFLLMSEASATPLPREENDLERGKADWKTIAVTVAEQTHEIKGADHAVTFDPALPGTEKEQEEIIERMVKDAHQPALVEEPSSPEEKTDQEISEKKAPPKAICIKLVTIRIDETELLTLDEQREMTDKYLNQCLESKLIKELLAEISGYYLEKGYVTTKAFLTPQDISDGEIEVKIIKGRVERIFFTGEAESRWQVKTAFAFQEGKVLNIRELENALENVNRLPSNNAKLNLLPGSGHGQTKVAIENEKSSPIRGSLGVSG